MICVYEVFQLVLTKHYKVKSIYTSPTIREEWINIKYLCRYTLRLFILHNAFGCKTIISHKYFCTMHYKAVKAPTKLSAALKGYYEITKDLAEIKEMCYLK